MGSEANSDAIASLSSVQLARLLDLELPGQTAPWSVADGTAALLHQLGSPLLPDLVEAPGAEPQRLAALSGGSTMLQALSEGTAAIELLSAIKEFARHVREQPASPLRQAPATVIYYAAIAAGLIRNVRITKLSDTALQEGFHWAQQQPGTESLNALFAQALQKIHGPNSS